MTAPSSLIGGIARGQQRDLPSPEDRGVLCAQVEVRGERSVDLFLGVGAQTKRSPNDTPLFVRPDELCSWFFCFDFVVGFSSHPSLARSLLLTLPPSPSLSLLYGCVWDDRELTSCLDSSFWRRVSVHARINTDNRDAVLEFHLWFN